MTVRPAEFAADPEIRVLLVIDRLDTDPGEPAIEELHRFTEESPENERLFIETGELMQAGAVTLAAEHTIDEWAAMAREGLAAEAAQTAPVEEPVSLSAIVEHADRVAANDRWFFLPVTMRAWVGVGMILLVGSFLLLRSSLPNLLPIGEPPLVTEFTPTHLPDSSPVLLYPGSRIDPKYSNEERRVDLEGGAAFTVRRDTRPFKVHAGDLVIVAKGTQFNVIQRSGPTDIALAEGDLEVFRNGALLLQMIAGDSVRIHSDGTLQETARHPLPVGGMTYAEVAAAFNRETAVFQIEVRGAARDMRMDAGNIADLSAPEAWIEVIQRNPALRVTATTGLRTIEATPSN